MPLNNISGKAFVAFVDISGFKKLMNTKKEAMKALDCFYSNGYECLRHSDSVQGIFVSDCGILIAQCMTEEENNILEKLNELLSVIRELNINMLKENYMLTTSIAFGEFTYNARFEFKGIEKNMFIGNAYLNAYLDNENKSNRLKPGQCRIVYSDKTYINFKNSYMKLADKYVLKPKGKEHIYFYWNLEKVEQIINFERKYKDAEDSVFKLELEALKETVI